MSYGEIKKQNYSEKGFLAENFVQNEFRVMGEHPTFSWNERNSEIEFLIKSKQGEILPIEVKSGKRTAAKSLSVYTERYNPKKTIKLIGNRGNEDLENIAWPIYYAQYLKKLIFQEYDTQDTKRVSK